MPRAILDRLATNETPEVSVERSAFFAHGDERFRILDRGRDLQPVAHNAFVAEPRKVPGSLPLKQEPRATLPRHHKIPRTRNGRETEE